MIVELVVSLDKNNCMGSSVQEMSGEDPAEKKWFREWLLQRLSDALIVLGRRTRQAMGAYALKLQKAYPNSTWAVVSRQSKPLDELMADPHIKKRYKRVLILGGQAVFDAALRQGYVDQVWVARIPYERRGDLYLIMSDYKNYTLIEQHQYTGFNVEIYFKNK